MKFNIGDKLHISGDITVTGAYECGDGIYSYNTEIGTFHEPALDKLVCAAAASVKPYAEPTEPAKPAFSWDAFKAGKIAVHCDTEEKAKAFLKECEERGLKWWIGADICAFIRTHLADESGLWFAHDSDGLRWFSSVESKMPESRYTIIDYPFSATPAKPEPAKEPANLYCVQDHEPGVWLTRGKTYDISDGHITYDFATGADLAYDRLMQPSKPTAPEPKPFKHLYSGKVVCVETHDDFTVGKVYTFKDGKVTDDSWTRRPMNSFVAESLEAWNSRYCYSVARFVEYKGEA